jgi:hypothetical protein
MFSFLAGQKKAAFANGFMNYKSWIVNDELE